MKKSFSILIAFIFIFAVMFLLFSGSAPTSELIEENGASQNREIMYGTIENTLSDPELMIPHMTTCIFMQMQPTMTVA